MKKYTFALIVALLLLAILVPSSFSFAQEQKTAREQLEPAWHQAHLLLDGVLNPNQQSELNILAYSAAVVRLCEGFSLDRENFKSGFNYLEHDDLVSMTPDETAHFERHLLVNYGISVGLFLAEGATDLARFCEEAATHRLEAEYHYWR